MKQWKAGDKVICNGNPDGTVIGPARGTHDMYEVRLWDGSRLVGEVVVSGSELNAAKEVKR